VLLIESIAINLRKRNKLPKIYIC